MPVDDCSSQPVIVYVLPDPVCPYAQMVPTDVHRETLGVEEGEGERTLWDRQLVESVEMHDL